MVDKKQHANIFWFRQDLRLTDNPGLNFVASKGPFIPIYIFDTVNPKKCLIGAASKMWLHHSLKNLGENLSKTLSFYQGDPQEIFDTLTQHYQIETIAWNRCYEPWRIKRDTSLKAALEKKGIEVKTFNASLLWEPWQIAKGDGTPFKVFTPFYKKGCLGAEPPRNPLPKPKKIQGVKEKKYSISLDKLSLLPTGEGWDQRVLSHWDIGESGAKKSLAKFLKEGLSDYKEGRNFPSKPNVSSLSPRLHHGELSPNSIWFAAIKQGGGKNLDHFLSELGWREFSYNLLYHNPHLKEKNLQAKFDAFPWKSSPQALKKWQKGQTGIPIVDAGMRQLWQMGYMHNRLRMIVGSFLVKNLLLHWHKGEEWFWDCLVDADLASNSAGWQWIAGCGADAAPYFRIFNPVMQGQKFDPEGIYTKKHLPELKNVPPKYLFNIWEAPDLVLKEAGVTLGIDYPKPIVDLKTSREEALAAFSSLKS